MANEANYHKKQESFFAYASASLNSVTGDSTLYSPIAFNAELFDTDNSYDTATYIYTCKRSGIYWFQCSLKIGGVTANHQLSYIDFVTTSALFKGNRHNLNGARTPSNENWMYSDTIASLSSGDTVYVRVYVQATDKTISILSNGATDPLSWFSGFYMGV